MVKLFKGTCEAVRAMHDYRAPLASKSNPNPSRENQSSNAAGGSSRSGGARQPQQNVHVDNGHSDDEEDEMFPHPEGDADGGYSYHGPGGESSVPLVSKRRQQEDVSETIFDGDEELERIQQRGAQNGNGAAGGETEVVPYAHRDLKPGYVHAHLHICVYSCALG